MDEKTKKIVWLVVKIVLVVGVAVFIGVAFNSATAAIMAGVASGIGSLTSLGSDTRRMENAVNNASAISGELRDTNSQARASAEQLQTTTGELERTIKQSTDLNNSAKRTVADFINRDRTTDHNDDNN
jgi:hypothetical protein